jgi:hypothetical protein
MGRAAGGRGLTGVLVAVVGALVLAGCGPATVHRFSADSVLVPPGGWPRPVDGKLTEQLCGLLTSGDLVRQRLPAEVVAPRLDLSALICGNLSTQYWLILLPNAESAGILFTAQRAAEQKVPDGTGITRQSSTGVVPGAQDSVLVASDLGTGHGHSTVAVAKRGALVVIVRLTGDDPGRPAVAGVLAALLLNRAPDLGRADTGPTLTVSYKVTGSGTAAQLDYRDPVAGTVVLRANVPLPWSLTLPYVRVTRENVPLFGVDAVPARDGQRLGCKLVAGDLVREDSDNGSVHCSST